MNIQIPIVLWTVICFAALYAILRFLLLKPLLELMDRRNAAIQTTKENAQNAADEREQARADALARREAELIAAQDAVKNEAETIRLEGKKRLEKARQERIAAVQQYAQVTEADYQRDVQATAEDVTAAAQSFLDELYADI